MNPLTLRNVFKRINIHYFIMTKTIVSTRTRSGRVSKVPERLDPLEDLPEDDFEEDDSDMDENGNLKGFVVDEDEEDEE